MKKTEILVIDDNLDNIQVAIDQFSKLENVNLTTMSSFGKFDNFFRDNWAKDQIHPLSKYDVVLIDLMMEGNPKAEADGQYEKSTCPEKIFWPFGIVIHASLKQLGVKHVGIVSMKNHHEGPFQWSLDLVDWVIIHEINGKPRVFSEKLNPILPLFDCRSESGKGWVFAYQYLIGEIKNKIG